MILGVILYNGYFVSGVPDHNKKFTHVKFLQPTDKLFPIKIQWNQFWKLNQKLI